MVVVHTLKHEFLEKIITENIGLLLHLECIYIVNFHKLRYRPFTGRIIFRFLANQKILFNTFP